MEWAMLSMGQTGEQKNNRAWFTQRKVTASSIA